MISNTVSKHLRVQEAAAYCGLSASTMNKLRLTGGGPKFIKLGRAVRYEIDDLNSWIESKKYSSTSEITRAMGA